MSLRSVILPFKYFYLGVYTVLEGSFRYFSVTLKLLVRLLKQLLLGTVASLQKLIINGFHFFKKLIVVLSSALITALKKGSILFYKVLKAIIVYISKGIKVIIIAIFKLFKLIILKTFNFIALLIVSIYRAVKFVVLKLYFIIKKIGGGLKKVIKYVGIYLYKIITLPFIFTYTFIRRLIVTIWDLLTTVFGKIKEGLKGLKNVPKKIKNSIVNWYNNLTLIKDYRNRIEMKRQALLIDFETTDAARSEEKITYRYVAKNVDGKIEKGKLAAYSKLDVHSYLLAEGYEVYEIEVYKGLSFGKRGFPKLKTNELIFLLTQLSTYIKAGIPLVEAIKILGKQTKKGKRNDFYRSIVYELTMGENLSEAFAKQGRAFPKLLINMVKSAELAGNLAETLDDMADYYTIIHKTRKQMISAMTYPTVIFVFALLVITFIMIFVIPEFVEIYKDMGSEISGITRFTIMASDFLQHNILYLVLGIGATIGGLVAIYSNVKMFKTLIQWLLMHIPVVGKIIIYNEVTMFAKTFASLLNHNVFITDSMEILSKITNNEVYKMLIFDTITNIARGESISNSFKGHWAFPIVAYEMLLTGERTGQPGPMMDKVADYYQEEHRIAINQVKTFIEPVMIVFITVIVGFILLSVILPMIQLYGQLG